MPNVARHSSTVANERFGKKQFFYSGSRTEPEVMISPKEKLHVDYLFMPLRPIKFRAATSNSLNSVIFAELELEQKIKFYELEFELGLANIA